MTTICFTGHRPSNKNLGGYNWNTVKNKKIMQVLTDTIIDVMDKSGDNIFTFICGGALGIDQMAFSVVEDLRNNSSKAIMIELASPFKDQDANWFKQEDKDRLQHEVNNADIVTYVDTLEKYQITDYLPDIYYPAKMQKRNEYMTDKSDIVIAVYDGSPKGGTRNCVEYAKKCNKKIVIINPREV